MIIHYWADFASPDSYIGVARLRKVLNKMGLADSTTLVMNAYQLDQMAPKEPAIDTVHRLAEEYQAPLEEAEEAVERVSERGRELGLDFNYGTTRYSNTFDAHRLVKFARSKGVYGMEDALFDAYFGKNLILSDRDVLVELAEMAGIDPQETRAMLESDDFAYEVRSDQMAVMVLGAQDVPFFAFEGRTTIPGVMTEDGFERAITKELKGQSTIHKKSGM